jgi:protein SCO1
MTQQIPIRGLHPARMMLMTLLLLLCASGAGRSQLYSEPKAVDAQQGKPPILQNIGIDQRLNQQLPLDLEFRDEAGQPVKLNQYFGKKPIILTMVYYTCPMLCSEVLSGIASSLGVIRFNVGQEFDVISVSINPHDTPADAIKKKKLFLQRYRRPGAAEGWHFLTGSQPAIDALAKAVGFHYAFDPKSGQYAHSTAIMVVTPEGKLAQYFYGIEYSPKDLRLSLIEASKNKIGTPVDQVLLFCFHYDPSTGHYSAVVMNVVRLAGILTALTLGLFMTVLFRKEKQPTPPPTASAGKSRNGRGRLT